MQFKSVIFFCAFILLIQNGLAFESKISPDFSAKLISIYQEYQDMSPSLSLELLQKDYEQDECKSALGLLINIVKKINAYQTILQNQCPKELKACLDDVASKKCNNLTQYNTYIGEVQQKLYYHQKFRKEQQDYIKQINSRVNSALNNYKFYQKSKKHDVECNKNDIDIVKQIVTLMNTEFDYNQYNNLKYQIKSPYSKAFLQVLDLYNMSNIYNNKTSNYDKKSTIGYQDNYKVSIEDEQKLLKQQEQKDIRQIKQILNELLEELESNLNKIQKETRNLQNIYIKTLQQSKKEIDTCKSNVYLGDHKAKNYERIIGVFKKKIELCKLAERQKAYCYKRYNQCKECQLHFRSNKKDLEQAAELLSQIQQQMIYPSQKY